MTYVVATSYKLHRHMKERLETRLDEKFVLIESRSQLNHAFLRENEPELVFLPHWSYRIPEAVYNNYECIVFHMTDVPFGRGGTPLQNLITRGIYKTQMSALRCEEAIDSGPVYMKSPLCLHGTAEEIFIRASKVIEDMIAYIVINRPEPVSQTGDPVVFPRRRPEESDISTLSSIQQMFDFIRMLDAENYPAAFMEVGKFRFEFSRASLKQGGRIDADVKIVEREG